MRGEKGWVIDGIKRGEKGKNERGKERERGRGKEDYGEGSEGVM